MNKRMDATLLTRRTHQPGEGLKVLDGMTLPLARAHEICGPARQFLAMLVAGTVTRAVKGPVFWIAPAWHQDVLNPEAMLPLAHPGRFRFVAAPRREDVLWTLEEVLRSGAAPLAVAELPFMPGMTAVRRLHLAAETGAQEGDHAPLGLLLTGERGGAPGIETRWHMAQDHAPEGIRRWALTRERARTEPPQRWQMTGRPGDWRLTPDRTGPGHSAT